MLFEPEGVIFLAENAKETVVGMHCVCRDCGARFDISAQELEWLKSRELAPFSRCKSCRMKRRAAR